MANERKLTFNPPLNESEFAGLTNAETLDFACDCARWLGKGDGTRELIITEEEEKQMLRPLGCGSKHTSRRNLKRSGYLNPRTPENI